MISGLVSCVGLSDDQGNKTRLPLNRMPTGFIEYQILFYNSSHKTTASLRYYSLLLFCDILSLLRCRPVLKTTTRGLTRCITISEAAGTTCIMVQDGPV